jgi:hypothetical protein
MAAAIVMKVIPFELSMKLMLVVDWSQAPEKLDPLVNGFSCKDRSRIAFMASESGVPAAHPRYDFADLLIACVTGLAFALVSLFLCVTPLTNIAGARDFVVFWATGQQLVHHANPYDGDAMMRIERSAGLPVQDGVMFMRNLPWALPIVFPLGFVGVRFGAFLWSLALLGCLLLSVRMLWQMHGSPGNYRHWLGVSFAPAVICLMMGQTSLFALFGYVLFLCLHQKRPFTAGLALWLCALKPHLFLPVGLVLLAWIVVSRSYKVLAGTAVAMAASGAGLYAVYPTAWIDYARMMRLEGIEGFRVPCLSVTLRFWLRPQSVAFGYLPAALGCIWALGYFWTRRHEWDWLQHGNLVMLVSLVTAPYSWVYDDGLAIPSLLNGAYLTRSRILLAILAVASIAIGAELLTGAALQSSFYLWTAPTWLLWYLCATRITKKKEEGIVAC